MQAVTIKTLLSYLLSYSTIELINKALPFIFLPILTAFLSEAEYGELTFIQLVFGGSAVLFSFGLTSIISVDYHKLTPSKRVYQLKLIISICVYGFLLMSPLLVIYSYYSGDYLYLLVFFSALCAAISNFFLSYFQIGQNIKVYSILSLSQTLLNVLFTILLVVIFVYGYIGRVLAFCLAPLFISTFFIWSFFGFKLVKFNVIAKKMSRYFIRAYPLLIHQISNWGRYAVDKFVLFFLIGGGALGEYNVNFQLAFIISILVMIINKTFQPFILKTLHAGLSARKLVMQQFLAVSSTGFFGCLGIVFFGDYFLNGEFFIVKHVIIVLCSAFVLQGFYLCICNYLYFYEKGTSLAKNSSLCLVVTILCSFPLISSLGALGAALSIFLSMLILFVGTFWVFLSLVRSK